MSNGTDGRVASAAKEILNVICDNIQAVHVLMVLCVILLTLSVISLLFIDRDSPSFPILQLNFAMLLSFLAVLGALYYKCQR